MQFDASPGAGCFQAVFYLKTTLEARIELNAYSCTLLADLVKACDSTKYEVVSLALKKWTFTKTHEIGGEFMLSAFLKVEVGYVER